MDPNSSYSKVYKLLLATPDGQALENELVRACDTAKITGVTFDLCAGEKHPEAAPMFKGKFGPHEFSARSITNISLRASAVVSSANCNVICDKRFGKEKQGGVSTFNCSRAVLNHGTWRSRGGHIDAFHEWAANKLGEKYAEKIQEAENRLKAELTLMTQSDEFRAARHEALKGYAIDAIVHVMSDYAWLGKEVLKEALDNFIVHDVIDC
jgi:hypothetical protein